jgi:hypothetical protein
MLYQALLLKCSIAKCHCLSDFDRCGQSVAGERNDVASSIIAEMYGGNCCRDVQRKLLAKYCVGNRQNVVPGIYATLFFCYTLTLAPSGVYDRSLFWQLGERLLCE